MTNLPPPPPPSGGMPPPPPPSGGIPPPAQPAGYAPYGQPQYGPPRASFGARLGAAIIDSLIVAAFNIPGWIALVVGPKEIGDCPDSVSRNPLDICEVPTDGTTAIAFTLFGLAFLGGIAYWSIMDGRGATVGKRAVGVRVADITTGQPIGTGRAIGRYFGKIISGIPCGLGYLWMLWDDQKQTWHDKMVSSVVVKTN